MNRSRHKRDASDGPDLDARVDVHVAPPAIGPLRASQPATTLCMTSTQIFGSALEVQIDHHGTLYRLKQTALGKLILTK